MDKGIKILVSVIITNVCYLLCKREHIFICTILKAFLAALCSQLK